MGNPRLPCPRAKSKSSSQSQVQPTTRHRPLLPCLPCAAGRPARLVLGIQICLVRRAVGRRQPADAACFALLAPSLAGSAGDWTRWDRLRTRHSESTPIESKHSRSQYTLLSRRDGGLTRARPRTRMLTGLTGRAPPTPTATPAEATEWSCVVVSRRVSHRRRSPATAVSVGRLTATARCDRA